MITEVHLFIISMAQNDGRFRFLSEEDNASNRRFRVLQESDDKLGGQDHTSQVTRTRAQKNSGHGVSKTTVALRTQGSLDTDEIIENVNWTKGVKEATKKVYKHAAGETSAESNKRKKGKSVFPNTSKEPTTRTQPSSTDRCLEQAKKSHLPMTVGHGAHGYSRDRGTPLRVPGMSRISNKVPRSGIVNPQLMKLVSEQQHSDAEVCFDGRGLRRNQNRNQARSSFSVAKMASEENWRELLQQQYSNEGPRNKKAPWDKVKRQQPSK